MRPAEIRQLPANRVLAAKAGVKDVILEYLTPRAEDARPAQPQLPAARQIKGGDPLDSTAAIDRTAKMYIGGKQARPDSGYSRAIYDSHGDWLADVGEGNRKDIRNAVEAAHKASGWASATAHNRAQVLFYIAENLAARAPNSRLHCDHDRRAAHERKSRQRLSACSTPRGPTSTTIGPPAAPAWDHGGAERANWRDRCHLPHGGALAGVCFTGGTGTGAGQPGGGRAFAGPPFVCHQLLPGARSSDLPGGVLNIVTGSADELARVLASHSDVDAVWRHDVRRPAAPRSSDCPLESLRRYLGGWRARARLV